MAGRYYSTTNIRKWDPSLNTIRKYIPELDSCTDEEVFNWHIYPQVNKRYPVPMVNDREEFEKYKRMVKK
jgi:deoxyribodipyrimidine photolyase